MAGTTTLTIGPADHGRRMSLDEFEDAEGVEGYLYELGRGIVVTEVPNGPHAMQIVAIRRQLSRYDLDHPGAIFATLGGSELKVLVADLESERHPDLGVYLQPMPRGLGRGIWSLWVPEIAIEVVSPGSRHRDYEEKPEEYFRFGVREYWILDREKKQMTVMQRSRGSWATRMHAPGQMYQSIVLPGFEFDCGPVFEAAESVT